VAESCKYNNEISGSTNGGKFLDYLSNYELLKEIVADGDN
jgi:hypothetical protein